MKKRFFVKSLHKMETPPPFYEVPTYFFPVHFWAKKEMILKGVWRLLRGVWRVFKKINRGMKLVSSPPPFMKKQWLPLLFQFIEILMKSALDLPMLQMLCLIIKKISFALKMSKNQSRLFWPPAFSVNLSSPQLKLWYHRPSSQPRHAIRLKEVKICLRN